MWTGAAVAAGSEPPPPLTRTEVHSAAISWQPLVAFETAVLTVSGPDHTLFRREFSAGEPIVFNVTDETVAVVGDGRFAYELRFMPVLEPEVLEILSTAREHDDHAIELELRGQGKIPDRDLVQSGVFTVLNGTLVSPELAEEAALGAAAGPRADARRLSRSRTTADGATREPVDASDEATDPVAKDQVILDDLIVDGSLCVGMDCVNGESFGFDTIRLKENNLRIKFQDTSSTASFPNRDWQIHRRRSYALYHRGQRPEQLALRRRWRTAGIGDQHTGRRRASGERQHAYAAPRAERLVRFCRADLGHGR
jgi:hypothetical protein